MSEAVPEHPVFIVDATIAIRAVSERGALNELAARLKAMGRDRDTSCEFRYPRTMTPSTSLFSAIERDKDTRAPRASGVPREESWHYWRECMNCGHAGAHYLHCLHDGVQSKCIKCDMELPSLPEAECACEFFEAARASEGEARFMAAARAYFDHATSYCDNSIEWADKLVVTHGNAKAAYAAHKALETP